MRSRPSKEESTSAMGRQKQHLEENTAASGGRPMPAVHLHKAERTIPSECMFGGGGGGGEAELFYPLIMYTPCKSILSSRARTHMEKEKP